jgi:hypothetical protein
MAIKIPKFNLDTTNVPQSFIDFLDIKVDMFKKLNPQYKDAAWAFTKKGFSSYELFKNPYLLSSNWTEEDIDDLILESKDQKIPISQRIYLSDIYIPNLLF